MATEERTPITLRELLRILPVDCKLDLADVRELLNRYIAQDYPVYQNVCIYFERRERGGEVVIPLID